MSEQDRGLTEKSQKVRFGLLDWTFIRHMAGVMTKPILEGKYREFGWQELDSECVKEMYFDSLMRHVAAARDGEYLDESGEPHWAAVAVNAMILWWHQRRNAR